jgi:hypothetical protein
MPEVRNRRPYEIYLLDFGALDPNRRIFRRPYFNTRHSKVSCIYPDSAAVEQFALSAGFNGKNEHFFLFLQQFLEYPLDE